jgi:O-phosphoseryl-tRNA(Cys) synthetase
MQDLEKQHRAQLLRLGAVALEMHQRGEIDGDDLMRLAADAAKAEEELRLARNR